MILFHTFILLLLLKTSHNDTNVNDTDVTHRSDRTTNEKWINLTNVERRMPVMSKYLDIMMKKKKQADNFYGPYWENGEKYFLKTTKAPGKWKAKKKYKKPLVTTSEKPTPPYKGDEMGINRDCYRDCTKLYSEDFGRVCGYRYVKSYWKYKIEFMEFENMCTLEQENCKFPTSRPGYVAVHRGVCNELTTFKTYPVKFKEILGRAENWQVNVSQAIKAMVYKNKMMMS